MQSLQASQSYNASSIHACSLYFARATTLYYRLLLYAPPHHIIWGVRMATLSYRLLCANSVNIISSHTCVRDMRYIPGIQQYHSNASTRSSIRLGLRKQHFMRLFLLPGMCHSSKYWLFWRRVIPFFTAIFADESYHFSLQSLYQVQDSESLHHLCETVETHFSSKRKHHDDDTF